MSETLDANLYVSYLTKIHSLIVIWEQQSIHNSPAWLQPALRRRQRRSMIEHDLAWFHTTPTELSTAGLPPLDTEAALLGAMYVMEGSTLGGQIISRHVTRVLGLMNGRGDAFFRGHGPNTGPMWTEFCDILRSRIPDAETEMVIHSAQAMFRTFATWMQQPQEELAAT